MRDDLSLMESHEGFNSCGSGEYYARAAMHALTMHPKIGLTSRQILHEAVETASRYVATVGGEVRYSKAAPKKAGRP